MFYRPVYLISHHSGSWSPLDDCESEGTLENASAHTSVSPSLAHLENWHLYIEVGRICHLFTAFVSPSLWKTKAGESVTV